MQPAGAGFSGATVLKWLQILHVEAMALKRGLVLEGGAMRGMFTAGVLDVMMENGVDFDGLIGVSAGACFGCNFKSRQAGRGARYNIRYCRDPRYSGLRTLLRTGDIYGADFCYREIPQQLDPFDYETFARNPLAFYVVCTDVETGESVYHCLPDAGPGEMEWIQASASMPGVSRVVRLEGRGLLDGGVSDSIPLRYFEDIGYGRNVVVLTQPEGYVKKPNRLLPLMRPKLRRYPRVVEAMARRHEMYNAATAYVRRREAEGSAFVIRPDAPLRVGHVEHDPEKLRACYARGRAACEACLPALRAFLDAPD